MVHGGRHDAERDVRRIERVVAERRGRILERGRAMHERHRPQRRFADRTAGDGEAARLADRNAPHGGELHEQIVGMLAIDQRTAVERFTRLKQFAVPALADGRGIEAEHRVQRQPAARHLAARCRDLAGCVCRHPGDPLSRRPVDAAARARMGDGHRAGAA